MRHRRNGDEEIRALERAALSGDPQDRANLLRALVRAGRVDPWLARVASSLGHDAASLVELPKITRIETLLNGEDRLEMRRRRWDIGGGFGSDSYVHGLHWYDEPHETGPEEDDGLTEEQRNLLARQRVRDDAKLGDEVSIKTLLWFRSNPNSRGPWPELPNREYALILLGSGNVERSGLVGEPLADTPNTFWEPRRPGILGTTTIAEYRGHAGGRPQERFWRLAGPVLHELADDAFLELADSFLGLPVVERREKWPEAQRKLKLWHDRSRTVWFELVPKSLREAVGVGGVDPATAIDEQLVLTNFAWPGGAELIYRITQDGETSLICRNCANVTPEPWTLSGWSTDEIEGDGGESVICGACERVIVEPEDEEQEPEDEQEEGPVDGDLVTENHTDFWEVGRQRRQPVVHVPEEDDDWRPYVRAYFERQQFWPNVWFQSDHGNLSILSLGEEPEPI